MLRSLLRLVPCRLRTGVVDYVRRAPADGSNASSLLKETHHLLSAQLHLKELNERYFPQSGMSEKEVVAATAARVGFQMPKEVEDAGTKQ